MKTETVKTLPENYHQKDWFLERIGQRVYRNPNGCGCDSCKSTEKNGLVITDRDQAIYLYDIQNEVGINYFEK